MNKLTKTLKKGFSASVVFMTVFSMLGLGALVPVGVSAVTLVDATTIEAGDLVQKQGLSSVYYITEDLTRMYFPNGEVFKTWFSTQEGNPDYSGIKVVSSDTDFDAFWPPQQGVGGINFRSGTFLVTSPETNSVYYVWPGNKRQKISNEAAAAALFGANWAGLVRDLPGVFLANLSIVSGEIDGSVLLKGMAVTAAGGDGSVWYFDGEMLHQVDGKLHYVHTVSQALIDLYEVSGDTKTAASITSNPAQGASGNGSGNGDNGNGDGDNGGDATVTISLAGDTPSGTFAVTNAIRVPFTKIGFTASGGDVTITSFKVKRGGQPANDSDFSKINVTNGLGDLLNDLGKTLNSDGEVTFTEDLVIPSGQTKYWTLVGDMASSVGGGNLPALELLSVSTDSTVVGSLPLAGNAIQVNSAIALGTVTLSEGAQVGNITEQVGDTNVNLANLKVQVAGEDFQVERVRFYNAGTANLETDLANPVLKYNNIEVATGRLEGKYVIFDLAGCTTDCKIEKGNDRTYALYGDLVGGSSRNVNLDIRRVSDVLVKDLKQGYYRSPVFGSSSAAAMTNTVTISEGRLTVSKTNDVQAGNVPENTSGIAFSSFNFKVQGEPITINTLVFQIVGSGSTQAADLSNIVLFNADGTALTGGLDGVGASATGYATSSDSFTLPVGDNVLTVKGTLNSDPAQNDTLQINIDMASAGQFDATGEDSGETIDVGTDATPQAIISGNTQTIRSAALRVTTLTTPPARTLAAGTNAVTVAEILLDAANSSEDIKASQVVMRHVTGSTAKTIDIQNCTLFVDKDGDSFDGAGSDVALSETKSGSSATADADESYTFNLNANDQIIVKKDKKVRVTVKCNIAGGAVTGGSATHAFAVSSTDAVAATGSLTGNTVSEVIETSSGNALTVGAAGGDVQVGIDANDPTAAMFAAGTSGVELARFNFLSTSTENVEIDSIQFTMRTTDTSSSSYRDYALLYVEDENGTRVGSVVPTSTDPVVDLDDDAFISDINDTSGTILVLKANLAQIGTQESITIGGHNLGFNIAAAGDVVAKGDQTGSASNAFLSSGSAPNGTTHLMFKHIPTFEKLALGSSTLTNGTNDLFKFKVSASGDIGLYKFAFDIATTGADVTSVELLDITESTEVSLHSATLAGADQPANHYFATLFDVDNNGTTAGGEERTVSASKARTYVLRGTVTGASSGDSVSTRIGGDAAQAVNLATLMASAVSVDSLAINGEFIWSDKHLGAHATSTNDWVNGYLVSGLNSGSSTAAVLSL